MVVKLYFVSNLRVASRALVSPSYKVIKLKEIITMHIHSTDKRKIFCSSVPNRKCGNFKLSFCRGRHGRNCCKMRAARAARLFFLVQPIRFLIHDVNVVFDVVDAEAHKYRV